MEDEMSSLQQQFQHLIDQGLIKPAVNAPHIEPIFIPETQGLRTVYNVGEVLIRDGAVHAELGAGSSGNSIDRRYTSQWSGWIY
jgi:hypothetical protein